MLYLAEGCIIQPLTPLSQRNTSFQISLSQLEGTLTSVNSSYIILRRNDTLAFVTYVPYRANEDERNWFLENRHACVHDLGEDYFATSIICKEIGEVTDIRSWEERDIERHSDKPFDVGYKKNKCRLCDRRMKNKISLEASEALRQIHAPGIAVQMVCWPRFLSLFNHLLTYHSSSKCLQKPWSSDTSRIWEFQK